MPSATSSTLAVSNNTTTTTSTTSTTASWTKSTQPPRSLLLPTLPKAFRDAKITLFTDATPPTQSHQTSRSRYQQPPPSSSSSAGSGSLVRALAWNPLGTLIAAADARALRVWNPERPGVKYSTELKLPASTATVNPAPASAPTAAASRNARPPPTPQPTPVTGTERVAWNPTQEAQLASLGSDGVLRLWDVRARSAPLVAECKVGGEGFSLAWAPDGDCVLVGRKDDVLLHVQVTSTDTNSNYNYNSNNNNNGPSTTPTPPSSTGWQMRILAEHPQSVQTNQCVFSHSCAQVLLSTGEGAVKICAWPALSPLHSLPAHTSSTLSLALSPTGRHLATGGSDALLTLWDTATFMCRATNAALTGPVRGVAFSPDGSWVAACSDEVTSSGGGSNGGGGVGGGKSNSSNADDEKKGSGIVIVHAESGEEVYVVPTQGGVGCLEWGRGGLAYAAVDAGGVRVLAVGGEGR